MLTFKQALPEQTGIPSRCIVNFIERLRRQRVPMHSILLYHRDHLIAEGYYAPYRADTLHRMFSVSKSFTSIAIGLLADEGKLSLDDPIVRYFPEKVPENVHPWISAMTIRDMLMMRTCHASTTYKVDMKSDWVESFFTVPPTHPSGKIFHYDTSSAHTLAALAERLSGMPMLDYLRKKLALLGLSEESYMLTDPFGVSMGGSGLVATSMDLLKFGYFIFHEGLVEGQQLLSSSYIREATSHLSDTLMTSPCRSEGCGYGYQFWRNEKGGYVCYGMGGQLIIFLPDYDLICVTTADTQGIGGGNQLIYDALYEEILPFIQGNPLPEDEKRHCALQTTLENLQIAPLTGNISSSMMGKVNDMVFRFADNDMEFSDMRIHFSDENISGSTNGREGRDKTGNILQENDCHNLLGTLEFTLHGEKCSLSFGLGELVTGDFPVYHQRYAASGVWTSEDTLYLRFHIIDEFVGSVHFEVCFGDGDVTVFMKKQEESLFKEFNGHLYGIVEK